MNHHARDLLERHEPFQFGQIFGIRGASTHALAVGLADGRPLFFWPGMDTSLVAEVKYSALLLNNPAVTEGLTGGRIPFTASHGARCLREVRTLQLTAGLGFYAG